MSTTGVSTNRQTPPTNNTARTNGPDARVAGQGATDRIMSPEEREKAGLPPLPSVSDLWKKITCFVRGTNCPAPQPPSPSLDGNQQRPRTLTPQDWNNRVNR